MEKLIFVTGFSGAPGEIQELSPGVRRLLCPNPSPYTFRGTCTYVVGRGEVAVIDPGPLNRDHLTALAIALRGERVSHILITHAHADHAGGAAVLAGMTGAPILAHGGAAGGAPDMMDASIVRDLRPDVRLADGDVVSGPGWSLRALHTPGHLDDHLCFEFGRERALFSGDHVMSWATSVIAPPNGRMADYMASLRLLLERSDQVFFPGHGDLLQQPQAFVRALIAHREARETAILEAVANGAATADEVVNQVYAGLDPRLHMAAVLSASAHIEHLVQQGLVHWTDGGVRAVRPGQS
jgi:glyoxylase-like metal-dependent hydrolase (beta-lactamase superfamily II)